MTAIIDYGVGNLFSLARSLDFIGESAIITSDSDAILNADRVILPGVGAFGEAMNKLQSASLVPTVRQAADSGKPLLGICLGMQLLFEKSFEFGEREGLGLIPGLVAPLSEDITGLKIPHMGWNRLNIIQDDPLFKFVKNGSFVYYVHSYYAKNCADHTLAVSEYGIPVTGVVKNGNVYGTQFHPEKSGSAGLAILKAFCEMEEK